MVVEQVLILGRTAPEWSDREGDLVSCTVGITREFEWRRLRFATLDQVRDLAIFTWANIDMTKPSGPSRDPRPESREVNPYSVRPIEVLNRIDNRAIRRWYIEKCVQPSVAYMRQNQITVGFVKPIDLEFEVRSLPAPPERRQSTLLSWAYSPYLEAQIKEQEWKRNYAAKAVEVKFKFFCGSQCEKQCKMHGRHGMTVLDYQIFMLYKNCARRRDLEQTIDCISHKIEEVHSKEDVYLGLGTHRNYPFLQYMVGGVMRFPRGLQPQQPTEVDE